MNVQLIKILKLLCFKNFLNYCCQFMYYTVLGNKALSRLPTNKTREDVTESVQTCVCMFGVTKKFWELVFGAHFGTGFSPETVSR